MSFSSLEDFFHHLDVCQYLVLRNYEAFNDGGFLNGHPDIDLLCDDVAPLVRAIGAVPRTASDDGLHYCVEIAENVVPIDVRHIGDGYYDTSWEKNMLLNRVKKEYFYVMGDSDYFYSLLYHACIHKKHFSADYKSRIPVMAKELNIDYDEGRRYDILNEYMKKQHYWYVYPHSHSTPAFLNGVDSSLIKETTVHLLRRKMGQLKRFLLHRGE